MPYLFQKCSHCRRGETALDMLNETDRAFYWEAWMKVKATDEGRVPVIIGKTEEVKLLRDYEIGPWGDVWSLRNEAYIKPMCGGGKSKDYYNLHGLKYRRVDLMVWSFPLAEGMAKVPFDGIVKEYRGNKVEPTPYIPAGRRGIGNIRWHTGYEGENDQVWGFDSIKWIKPGEIMLEKAGVVLSRKWQEKNAKVLEVGTVLAKRGYRRWPWRTGEEFIEDTHTVRFFLTKNKKIHDDIAIFPIGAPDWWIPIGKKLTDDVQAVEKRDGTWILMVREIGLWRFLYKDETMRDWSRYDKWNLNAGLPQEMVNNGLDFEFEGYCPYEDWQCRECGSMNDKGNKVCKIADKGCKGRRPE